jgi:hypothetical protein
LTGWLAGGPRCCGDRVQVFCHSRERGVAQGRRQIFAGSLRQDKLSTGRWAGRKAGGATLNSKQDACKQAVHEWQTNFHAAAHVCGQLGWPGFQVAESDSLCACMCRFTDDSVGEVVVHSAPPKTAARMLTKLLEYAPPHPKSRWPLAANILDPVRLQPTVSCLPADAISLQ